MKRLIITLLLSLVAAIAAGQDDALATRVTEAVDKAVAGDQFSGVVLLAKEGKPLLSRAWGMADPARGVPNEPDTKFNLGSINKIFTKVAIAQLAAAGKLSVTDTVRKHLPDYPSPVADKITIQQLVDHRSGLGDVFGPGFESHAKSLKKIADYLPLFADKPLEFEPGTSQRYSNAGYIVLGLIIERLSGQSYYDYVRDHITRPAGMKDTASFAVDETVANRAIGQTRRGPTGPLPSRQPNTATLPARGSSAGGGYSTAADLLRFTQALSADKLTPPPWTDWVFKMGPDAPAQRSLGIAGGAPGINGILAIRPPYTLVVLSNYDPPSAEQLMQSIRPLIGGKEAPRVRVSAGEPDEVIIHGPVHLPMVTEGHVPVIEAKVNGKGPFRFQLDTGFGGVMELSTAVVEQLALPTVGETTTGDPSGRNNLTVKVHRAESVDIGDLHLGGVEVWSSASARLRNADGIVGLNLFKSLLITLDYPHNRIDIGGGSLPATSMSYSTEHGVPHIDIEVAGQKMTVDIDSGSPAELTLPLGTAKSLPLAEEPRVVGHGRTVANEFDVYAAPLKGEVRVGDIVLTNPRVDFVDLFPVGNLGARFLGTVAVTFDPANRRVRFVKSTSS